MNRKRRILEEFLNGKTKKLNLFNNHSIPPLVVLESYKEGIIETVFNGELIKIPFNEVDDFLAKNMPKSYFLFDLARTVEDEMEKNHTCT